MPQLARDYGVLKAAGRPVEVVWLSCDRDEGGFWDDFRGSGMPWLGVPFDAPEREQALASYKVTGIPRLVVLSPTGGVLVENAVGVSLTLPTVDAWCRQAGIGI